MATARGGTLVAFLAGAVSAAGNPISVKFSNVELSPLWGATLRCTLAAALMLIVMAPAASDGGRDGITEAGAS